VRRLNETRPNAEYLAHQEYHRLQYNPNTTWYEWQTKRKGKEQLCRQNDKAYGIYVKKRAGLHEQHLAEELHRYSVFPAQYTDTKGTVSVDPSVPPMGDLYKFHGSIWNGKRFDDMWIYWTRLYPAHAYDIERELFNSKKEVRSAWWNKSIQYTPEKQSVGNKKRKGVAEPRGLTPVGMISDTRRGGKGYFELTYLDSPCRICGGMDHPALRGIEDDYGAVTYKYVCRVAAAIDWESICMRPCPEKMAKECCYDEEEMEKMWVRIVMDGWGQTQSSKANGHLLRMARLYCERKGVLIPTEM